MTNEEIVKFMVDILDGVVEYGGYKLYTDYAGYIKSVEYNADVMSNLIAIVNDKANYKNYLTDEVTNALLGQYRKIYWQLSVLVELEVNPADTFNGFKTEVKEFFKRNPRFYILHRVGYLDSKLFTLVSVTNTDDYVETTLAYVERLIREKGKFHNNQLPIHKPDTTQTKIIDL